MIIEVKELERENVEIIFDESLVRKFIMRDLLTSWELKVNTNTIEPVEHMEKYRIKINTNGS